MPAIGHVALQGDGRFRGTLATVTLRAPIEIVPTVGKTGDTQPDYRVIVNGVEIGAAWSRTSQQSGKPYVSVTMDDPAFPDTIHANLGRAAGQDDPNVFALIWNRPRQRQQRR